MSVLYFTLVWAGLTSVVSWFVNRYGTGAFAPREVVGLVAVLVLFWLMPIVAILQMYRLMR